MNERLQELLQQLRFWGARGLVRSVHYSLLSTWGQLKRKRVRGPFREVGHPLEVQLLPNGAHVRFERAGLELRFLRPDLVRLTWEPGMLPLPYALVPRDWPEVKVELREEAAGWEFVTDALRVAVSLGGGVRFYGPDGSLLRQERPPERRGTAWRHRARLREDEHLYGLGEHTGPLNLRGSTRRLWNADPMASYGPERGPLYLNIPVYQTLHAGGGYLLFYENSYPATLNFGREARATFEGGALRYYLTPGPPSRTLRRYTELTGRPPLPPRWALGYHQSRFSYLDEGEVREVVRGFRSRGLPLSAVHLDIHYMDGFRVFTIDKERFPDLGRLSRDLEAEGVKLVVILDPGVKRDPGYRVYREGLEQGMFCRTTGGRVAVAPVWPGWSAFPDFTDPEVRRWWGEQYRALTEMGVAGFWNDMNEPSMTALWGERTLAHNIRHALEGRGGDHLEAHNLYGLLMVRAGFEGLRRLRPERRPFFLTRSGWAGVQRYAWMWTGDISSAPAMLRQTVATVLGLGLSGMPYAGPDIGGFKGALTPELYGRWFELATFLPFFRTHSAQSTARREPWRFGPEVLAITRRLLELRMALLPYLYTLAWEAHSKGHPLVRPLLWLDERNPELWGVDDAFLLGDALLVAPALRLGARRPVVFPPGRWYGFWDDGVFRGAAEVEAPPGRPPLFVRGGSVLPLEERGELVLHLYAPEGDAGGGVLYGDEGDGYGAHRVDRFRLQRDGDAATLVWEAEGDYPFPYGNVWLHLHGFETRRVWVDGQEVTLQGRRVATGPFREVRLGV